LQREGCAAVERDQCDQRCRARQVVITSKFLIKRSVLASWQSALC
jgi:hypothetical protein